MITIDISVKLAKYFDDRLISDVLENIEFAGGLLTFKYDANEDCFTKKQESVAPRMSPGFAGDPKQDRRKCK